MTIGGSHVITSSKGEMNNNPKLDSMMKVCSTRAKAPFGPQSRGFSSKTTSATTISVWSTEATRYQP